MTIHPLEDLAVCWKWLCNKDYKFSGGLPKCLLLDPRSRTVSCDFNPTKSTSLLFLSLKKTYM